MAIVKYWFKILVSEDDKYIKMVYNLMLKDIETVPNTVNWASLVRHLLISLGFYEVWMQQGVGYYRRFISLLKQRVTDTFIQNWGARLGDSSRANFYKSFAVFQLQPYLDKVNINKFSQAFSRLRMSSHRLEVESGRWVKPNAVPFDERKLTQFSPRSYPRHLVGKGTTQQDAVKDTISDSQVNSCIPYRWPPASLTFNIYCYLFFLLYLYITRIMINNGTAYLKSPKNQHRKAALGRPAIKLGGFN